tara:strand:- start:227 stop:745 length:519 start_codon:yes stop_codon:yes gene_type:complete
MSQYGELLEDFRPERDEIRKHINKYFNHPVMVKIKDVDEFSVYMSKMYCLLSNECRYLVAFISRDNNEVGMRRSLEHLPWNCFQTRTLPDQHDLPPHSYNPSGYDPLNVTIRRYNVTPENSEYTADKYNINLALLHKNNNVINDYQDTGTIIAALETYQTIITFIETTNNIE